MAIGATRSLTAGASDRYQQMRSRGKAMRELRSRQRERREQIRDMAEVRAERRARRVQRAQNTASLVGGIHYATLEQSAGMLGITLQMVQERTLNSLNKLA